MKIRSLLLSLAMATTAFAADPKPAPAAAPVEAVDYRHACDLVQKQRDDLASQLLTANVQIQLLQERLQALLAAKVEPKKEGK